MAAFVSIVIGAFISDFLAAHVEVLTAASERIGGATTESTGAVVPEEVAGLLAISASLAFPWGVAYHYVDRRSATGPKDYTADDKRSGSESPMVQRASSIDEAVDADDPTYRAAAARRADELPCAELRRTLDEARSRLEDIHDRCVDAGRRDRSGRMIELDDAVTRTGRTIGRMTGPSCDSGSTDGGIDDRIRNGPAETHGQVVEIGENPLESVRTVHEASPDVAETHLEGCEKRCRTLERALADRRDALQEPGEKDMRYTDTHTTTTTYGNRSRTDHIGRRTDE